VAVRIYGFSDPADAINTVEIKCMKIMLWLALIPMTAPAMDRLTALSNIETGNNDAMVGRAGEISRYQVLKAEWRSVTSSTSYRDPEIARLVTLKLLEQRVDRFKSRYNRNPNDFEFYALWNAPTQALTGRISRTVAERCQRFANLCSSDQRPAGYVTTHASANATVNRSL